MFEKAIDDLSKLKNDDYLSFDRIEFWLLKYSILFTKSIKQYSCSHFAVKLPCMCKNRNADCLFIDIYKVLETFSAMSRKNLYYTEQLIKYSNIKENFPEVQSWLLTNIAESNIDLPYSANNDVYYDKQISLCNGKFDDEYNYFDLKIKGFDFKSSYDFSAVYDELFYRLRILPEEYERWKKDTGYEEM
jgi:hypothetical protein